MVWQGKYDRLFIGGEWIAPQGSERIAVISPTTEEVIAEVPSGSRADIDHAVAAARRGFDKGPWPRLALEERRAVLRRLSVLFTERADDIAAQVTEEMGCPITLSKSMQSVGARLLIDAFVDMAPDYEWQTLRQSATGNGLVLRQPIGVVAAIIPWNAPLLTAMIKLAPALLSGCTVILKPAPESPLSAWLLAEMLSQAGLPEGVVNIVPADREVSEYLAMHPDVDKVTFTGSTAAGQHLGALCGQQIRRLTLELGGKSAAIITDDADFDHAVGCLRMNALRNSGQVCSNKTRILVSKRRQGEFLEALSAMMATMPVGDPRQAETQIGPMVSRRQRERVNGYIDKGRAEARLAWANPATLPERGWFVTPTIFADVGRKAVIAQEEIFGPVLAVIPYEDEDDAIAIANDSIYGLNGSVFTGDPERGVEIARRIQTGTVEINGNGVGFHAPIGGFKKSGIGREAGLEGFDAYVEIKSIGLPKDLATKYA
ncbi:MAG: aldehyde dehydrogenase [Paracoccus sp. BP8]|uniref:aldehyde dehydrogenase n=1 Tax=Paracoccus sp. J39 TaxID=935848 RepID=UPI0004915039|nr:aldehyde dehydrogenase [Paracoccus sp. J39]RQP04172.1 MAG: aldehyde dehydrogenase [Paracoccus sp. BP8]